MVTYIKTKGGFDGSTLVEYVPIGTIGWLKTKDNKVRQAKLVKIVWDKSEKGITIPICEWKIAGIDYHVFSTDWCTIPTMGKIYDSEFNAQHGSAVHHSTGYIRPTETFNIETKLVLKYGAFDRNRLNFSYSASSDFLGLVTIGLKEDGTFPLYYETPFCIMINEYGVHVSIPSVDNGTAFLSFQKAYAAYKPNKSITFEDAECKKKEQEETITLKVEINKKDLEQITKFAKAIYT